MSEPITYPPPVLELLTPPRSKWEREYRAFLQLLPVLLTTHRGQYVAIHEGQVVDSGAEEIALAQRVFARCGYVPIHIDLVTDQPRPRERIPHYHVLRQDTAS